MNEWTLAEARIAARELCARSTLVPLAFALVAAFLLAWLELRSASGFALERTLHGPVFGMLVPLGSFVLTRSLFGTNLDESLRTVRFGANRHASLFGRVLALLGAETLFAWGICAAVVLTTGLPWGASGTARLFGVATAAALAHGSMMIVGVSLLRFGAGLTLFLDWLLGNGLGILAMPWPRAHVRGLLGGEAPLDLGTSGSWAALAFLVLSYLAVAALRTKP